jgi:hypothetical protein
MSTKINLDKDVKAMEENLGMEDMEDLEGMEAGSEKLGLNDAEIEAEIDERLIAQQMMQELFSSTFEMQIDEEGNTVNIVQALFTLFRAHFESNDEKRTNVVDAINTNTKVLLKLSNQIKEFMDKSSS